MLSDPKRIMSDEVKRDTMFQDFALSTQKSFVDLKKQYSTKIILPVRQPSKESVKDIIKKVLCDGKWFQNQHERKHLKFMMVRLIRAVFI